MKNLLVINGHPDPRPERFCSALSSAYERGAGAGGWQTRRIDIGNLPLSSIEAMNRGGRPDVDILEMQADVEWANRLAIVFPLWFDEPPDALCALFEHLGDPHGRRPAHVIVTMEMPAFAYRSMLRAGAPKNSATGLAIPGIVSEEPVLIGCVNTIDRNRRRGWLETVRDYGERTTLGTARAPSRSLVIASMIDRTVMQWWHG